MANTSKNDTKPPSFSTHCHLAITLIVYLAVSFYFYGSTGDDDPYITYSAAYIFSQTGAILNINGEFIEQSSSLLLTVLLGGLHRITGLPLPWLGLVVSLASGALVLVLLHRQTGKLSLSTNHIPGTLLIICPLFAYWASSGMETTLLAAIILGLLFCMSHIMENGWSRSCFMLFMLLATCHIAVRPESALVIYCALIIAVACLLWKDRQSAHARQIGVFMALILVPLLLIVGWRMLVYEHIFPQPVYAKSAGISLERIQGGLGYLTEQMSMGAALGLMLFAATFLIAIKRDVLDKKPLFLLSSAYVVAHLGFVIASGGDFMEGGRFIAPVLPLMIMMAFISISQARYKWHVIILWIAVMLVDAYYFITEKSLGILHAHRDELVQNYRSTGLLPDIHKINFPEYANRLHMQDLPVAIRLNKIVGQLRQQGADKVTILSGQMGLTPYYLIQNHFRHVEFIDRFGLVSTHFSRCPVTTALPRTPLGLSLTLTGYISLLTNIKEQCGIELPMIIYDQTSALPFIEGAGYSLVYIQGGSIDMMGAPTAIDQFIAVRTDLLPGLEKSMEQERRVL